MPANQSQWINYHHLFYFKAVAEEGSVSRAAQKLRIGQPTLSAQLKQFESSLGIALFERSHKRLNLTEQGKVALEYAKNIFRLGSEMVEVLNDRIHPTKAALHIGALDSIPKQIIVQLAKHALKNFSCVITLSEGRPDDLLRELQAHRIDLLLTDHLPTGVDSKGLRPRTIARKNIGVYASPEFRSLRKGFPKSISSMPVILPSFSSRLRQDLEHWASLQKIELNAVAEGQDIAVKKLMAIEGLGILPSATHTVTGQVLRGELIELGQIAGMHEELLLVSANRKIRNPIADKLFSSFKI